MKILKRGELKHGMAVKCIIDGVLITDAKISIEGISNWVYVCHNDKATDGGNASDKLGYEYSWLTYRGDILDSDVSMLEPSNQVEHPKHYNLYPVEAIDLMVGMFGRERVKDFCLLNAMKYRLRLGLKDDFSQDLAKEKWYLDKYNSL